MKNLEKLGSKKRPICVSVWDEEALERVAKTCEERKWVFIAKINPEEDEDLSDLALKLQFEKMRVSMGTKLRQNLNPLPNNFCPCNSGKKFKKCCMSQQLSVNA